MMCLNTFWKTQFFLQNWRKRYRFFSHKYFVSAISSCFADSDRLWIEVYRNPIECVPVSSMRQEIDWKSLSVEMHLFVKIYCHETAVSYL